MQDQAGYVCTAVWVVVETMVPLWVLNITRHQQGTIILTSTHISSTVSNSAASVAAAAPLALAAAAAAQKPWVGHIWDPVSGPP